MHVLMRRRLRRQISARYVSARCTNKMKLFSEAHHYLKANGTRQSEGVKNRLQT